MRKLIILMLLIIPFVSFGQKGFTVSGSIGIQRQPLKAYLIRTDSDDVSVRDSVEIKDGSFYFKGSVVVEPQLASLVIRYKGDGTKLTDMLSFYVENADIKIVSSGSIREAKVTGSLVNEDNEALKALVNPVRSQLLVVNGTLARALKMDPKISQEEWYHEKQDSVKMLSDQLTSVRKAFIRERPSSYVSMMLFSVNMTMYEGGKDEAMKQFDRFSQQLKKTGLGKKTLETVKNFSRRQIGISTIDFTQNDINGKPFKLSSLRGKYVLVDFWASWCVPCREENPNVVKAYSALKNKGFEIVGVSLDANQEAWANAIKQDGLPWIHVSDLKGWKNELAAQFYIQSVPQNFLIDPKGVIVAVNLRGGDLEQQLAKYVK